MESLSRGSARPLIDAMAEDVTWQWMGVNRWSKTFVGRDRIAETLFGGAPERANPSSFVEVHHIHGDGDCVIVEHRGRNELPDGRRYDNNYCWVLQFQDGLINAVREYMDTQ